MSRTLCRLKRTHTPVPDGIRIASTCQRRRTPPALAVYLVSLARLAGHVADRLVS